MICEGCKQEITVFRFPYLERVWDKDVRQFWHTNCFVYAYPPGYLDPPSVESKETLDHGAVVCLEKPASENVKAIVEEAILRKHNKWPVIDDKVFKELVLDVEADFGIVGLAETVYEDFTKEVLRRYLLAKEIK